MSSDTLLTNSLGDGSTLSLDFTTMSSTADLTARGLTFTRASTTATYINSSGYVTTAGTNVARLDYDPTTLAPRGLLVEGQATNLLTYSEDYSQAVWTKATVDRTTGQASPDNGTGATLLSENATTYAKHSLERSQSITAGVHTFSVWVKEPSSNSRRYVCLQLADGQATAARYTIVADLQTGQITASGSTNGTAGAPTNTGHSITPYPGGWYRLTITMNHVSSPSYPAVMLSDVSTLFGGNNQPFYSAAAPYKGLIVWGAQLEAGSATSYIPTGASQGTRVSEVCYITNTDYGFTTTGGTYFVEWERGEYDNPTVGGSDCFAFSTDYASGRWLAIYTAPGSTTTTVGAWTGGINQGSTAVAGRNRAAVSYAGWNATTTGTLSVNGSSPTTSATMALGTTPTYLMIGAASQTAPYNGGGLRDILGNRVRRLKYWPFVLPSATLQSITVNTP